MVRVQNILQSPGTNISMMSVLVIDVVSNEGTNPICHTIHLLKDVPNSHYDRKTNKAPDITEDQMGIQLLCFIPDLANNSGRIILEENPPNP